mmetsp:Transcript_5473/g.17546  ORF Transcript_5473/g.17546 Transcript_5473/m.17546 type:complete len:362 (+) Transcript_5473:202-1287(+)
MRDPLGRVLRHDLGTGVRVLEAARESLDPERLGSGVCEGSEERRAVKDGRVKHEDQQVEPAIEARVNGEKLILLPDRHAGELVQLEALKAVLEREHVVQPLHPYRDKIREQKEPRVQAERAENLRVDIGCALRIRDQAHHEESERRPQGRGHGENSAKVEECARGKTHRREKVTQHRRKVALPYGIHEKPHHELQVIGRDAVRSARVLATKDCLLDERRGDDHHLDEHHRVHDLEDEGALLCDHEVVDVVDAETLPCVGPISVLRAQAQKQKTVKEELRHLQANVGKVRGVAPDVLVTPTQEHKNLVEKRLGEAVVVGGLQKLSGLVVAGPKLGRCGRWEVWQGVQPQPVGQLSQGIGGRA